MNQEVISSLFKEIQQSKHLTDKEQYLDNILMVLSQASLFNGIQEVVSGAHIISAHLELTTRLENLVSQYKKVQGDELCDSIFVEIKTCLEKIAPDEYDDKTIALALKDFCFNWFAYVQHKLGLAAFSSKNPFDSDF